MLHGSLDKQDSRQCGSGEVHPGQDSASLGKAAVQSREGQPTDHNDDAFMLIDDALTILGDVASASTGGRFSQAFSAAGTAQIAFGIVDVLDYGVTSRLDIGAFDLALAALRQRRARS